MPPDDTDTPATGKPRVVRRGNMVAVEEDGVVTIHKLRVVPSALWNCPYWQHLALPDWASNIETPSEQFLALAIHLAGQKQDVIDALKATIADLRQVRRLIAALGPKDAVPPVDEVGKRLRSIVEDLDR